MQAFFHLGQFTTPFDLEATQWQKVEESFQRLHKHIDAGMLLYGTHTHFGAQHAKRVDPGQWAYHQLELLRYLQVGVGPSLSPSIVRRALRLQLQKVAQGYSGVSVELIRAMIAFSKGKQMPQVPRHGSLGASGDLVPMAHAVAPLFETITPGPRDVLALVNTNSMMASVAIEAWIELEELWLQALEIHAAIVFATQTSREFLKLGQQPPISLQHPEQAEVAGRILERLSLLETSMPRLPSPGIGADQPRYSLRCSPQILGVSLRQMRQAAAWILEETQALSDNPVIFEDGILHGGLFYASGLATASDLVQDVIGKIAEWLDRQVLLLMDPKTSGDLPQNLEVPTKSHCKGLHQLISALTQRLRALAMPCRLMSFSCESHNQDVVPCAMEGWNLVTDQLEGLKSLIQAAHFCAKRAVAIRKQEPIDPLESWKSQAIGRHLSEKSL